MFPSSNGFDIIIIANKDDGHLAFLEGGPGGLILSPDILESPELPNPTDLAFSSFIGDRVEFYATTEGREAATLLTFLLGGESGSPDTSPAPGGIAQVAQLLPLRSGNRITFRFAERSGIIDYNVIWQPSLLVMDVEP